MQVTAEQPNPCTVVLDITVDEPQVSRAFDSSFREFSRYVNVPGFRPGKAPRSLVERYVDMERLRRHTLEKIVRDTFPKVLEEKGITPYSEPDVEPTDLEDKKPYTYRLIVPLEPQVTVGQYTGLTVQKPIFAITEADVDKQIDQIRQERARLERVTDRGIAEGDVVIVEQQVVIAGEENAEPPRRQLIYLGQNVPGYDEQIIGLNPGDEKSFTLTFPDDFSEVERQGKEAVFNVKIGSISAKKLPELTDEFANEVARVESVELLRTAVHSQLLIQAERLSNEVTEQRLIEQILQTSTVHFPSTLVREELKSKLNALAEELNKNKTTYEAFLQRIGRTAEQHQQEIAMQAAEQIRALLVLRGIAINENLDADDDAVDAAIEALVASGQIAEESANEFLTDPQRRLQIANAVIQEKLHAFLFASNTITEVKAGSVADAETTAEVGETDLDPSAQAEAGDDNTPANSEESAEQS